ncbi:uncharacterized protein LOC122858211 [Aphidius gifuensis]|uniref:uncharacterized protein LOC122858211 n=1 Tax=Aphidius gifuensis TaxID=684658 RepID=UPI001CDD4E67|nr:uncharacterized protein LOC122858211 [Aphidius gifuensis]
MIRMGPLFISQPRLKKICKDGKNEFLSTCFTKYTFRSDENDSVDEIHEKANDLKYLLNLCGFNLTRLDVSCYPTSQIMPIITANCLNLEKLFLGFKEIMSQDFENCFSNMSQLKNLTIEWHCENSTLPMTLAKSIEQISGTLKTLGLLCMLKGNDIFSPDSLASVFPRLIALDCLHIRGFGLSQLLLQSIGEMKNVVHLKLHQRNNYPVWDTRVNMYPIGNLKNLESLHIDCNDGVRDEFLINLCNNAKRLKFLYITGTHITDIGMSAINNLEQLEVFNLLLTFLGPGLITNKFITNESVQCLFNPKLRFLDISNCINITDKGVFELLKNLPKLRCLSIENTKLTSGAIKKIWNLPKLRNGELNVFYPTKTANVSI